MQCLIAPCFAGLTLKRTDLALHFFDHVADAKEIRFGRFEFAQRFLLLRFVFSDSGGFFKNAASIFGTRTQDQIDLALLHDGVGGASDAGVGEQTVDVL